MTVGSGPGCRLISDTFGCLRRRASRSFRAHGPGLPVALRPPAMETLRRVARVHRRQALTRGRRAAWLLACAAIVAGAASWLALRQTLLSRVAVAVVEIETETIRDVPRGPLLSLRIESPRAPAGAAPLPCPPLDLATDPVAAGRPYTPATPAPATAFTDVLPSPTRARWLAARAGDRAYLSRDDGRHFEPVLDRPGALIDLAFGCAGELYALRRGPDALELGVHTATGDRWRPLRLGACVGDLDDYSLEAGGGWLAVLVAYHHCAEESVPLTTAWLSPDAGASWRPIELPDSPVIERVDVLDLRADRLRLVAYEGDCMYDGTVLHDLDPRTGKTLRTRALSRDFQLWRPAARGRWAYADHRSCDGSLCRARLDAPPTSDHDDSSIWTAILPALHPDPVYGGSDDSQLLAGPRHLYSLDPRGLWRLSAGRARPAGHPPASLDTRSVRAVDLAGRLLALSPSGHLLRWSRRHGLRTLADPPPDR